MKEFQNRKMLIASKHQKEKVMQPLLEKELGVSCFVTTQFDTDSLGTFSGETPREEDALSTLRKKCLMAMEAEGYDLAVASEGSFGNHPSVFFAPADEELVLLIDRKNNLEVVAKALSMETNFLSATIQGEEELQAFAEKVGFPEHALIVRPAAEIYLHQEKGIEDPERLWEVFYHLKNLYGSCYVETDMRAMYNPTRMKVIERATQNLLEKLQARCPSCTLPGFSVTEAVKGLPCAQCRLPTRSTLRHLYRCAGCGYEEEQMFPHGTPKEDPMYCDFCNP